MRPIGSLFWVLRGPFPAKGGLSLSRALRGHHVLTLGDHSPRQGILTDLGVTTAWQPLDE